MVVPLPQNDWNLKAPHNASPPKKYSPSKALLKDNGGLKKALNFHLGEGGILGGG